MAQQNRDEERRVGEEQRVGDWRVRLEAMIGELTRSVRMQYEETQERFEQLENARNRQPPHGPNVSGINKPFYKPICFLLQPSCIGLSDRFG